MPPKSVKYTLLITAEQDNWIRAHPEVDIPALLRQTIMNQMRKSAQKIESKKHIEPKSPSGP
jgi:hypothetical protein